MLHAIRGSFASMDNRTPAMDKKKGFSMDARKCSSEPCLRFMEKYPRMTLADPWMGGSGHNEKMKFIKNNHNLVVANSA